MVIWFLSRCYLTVIWCCRDVVSPFLARIQNMRDVVTILKMIVRLGVRMLQRQARNGPTRCAVGSSSSWIRNDSIIFEYLTTVEWFSSKVSDSEVIIVHICSLRHPDFRNIRSQMWWPPPKLSSLRQAAHWCEPFWRFHGTMTEPFVRWETGITWNDPNGLWRKSLAVLLTATHSDSAGNLWKTECSQCRTKWSHQIAKRAHRKQLVLSEPEQNEHRNQKDPIVSTATLQWRNSLQNTKWLASLHSNSSNQFEFNSEQSSSSRSRACTKSSEKRANEWDYLWSCNSK